MPFSEQQLLLFNQQGITWLVEGQSGVYGIFNRDVWIYIGKADDLRQRLLEHHNRQSDQSVCIWNNHPTNFVATITDVSNQDITEQNLIAEYNPI